MNLTIDLGNSLGKAGVFDNGKMKQYFEKIKEEELLDLAGKLKPKYIIVSSVRLVDEKFYEELRKISDLIILNSHLPMPIEIDYATPQTLGVDRIAAVAGANTLYPNQNCLVIDLGTCITYDFVDDRAVFHGGNITPGMNMRFKALHHFTAKLPLVEMEEDSIPEFTGKSTKGAILSGVIHGIRLELEGVITHYKEKFAGLTTLLTGGDAFFFEKILKEQIFVVPKLTLTGLNRILEYNAAKIE